jgi:hypothetical protein
MEAADWEAVWRGRLSTFGMVLSFKKSFFLSRLLKKGEERSDSRPDRAGDRQGSAQPTPQGFALTAPAGGRQWISQRREGKRRAGE